MSTNAQNRIRRLVAHFVLITLSFMCLFFFYILIINATHSHAELQRVSQLYQVAIFLTI